MKQFFIILLCLSSFSANATSFSFTGNFTNDDDIQLFNFSVNALSTVTLRTWSYAGGLNANGNLIVAGGFDPVLSLFDNVGNLINQNDDADSVAVDPSSGEAYDALFTENLIAGDYIVSISQFANFISGPTLADGFGGSGQAGFDGRSSFWAVEISSVDTASAVPIPAAVWLFSSGLIGLLGIKKQLK